MKILGVFCALAALLIFVACATEPPKRVSPSAHARFSDAPPPARACLDEEGPGRTFCVIMIGAERTRLAGSKFCSPVPPGELADTYAVMDWIRAHPEAQDEELGPVIEQALSELHPCA